MSDKHHDEKKETIIFLSEEEEEVIKNIEKHYKKTRKLLDSALDIKDE